MKPVSHDDELSTQRGEKPEPEKQPLEQASDPNGEALLEVLQSERPLTPEEIPDIFAPEELAARLAALQKDAADDERALMDFSRSSVGGLSGMSVSPSGASIAAIAEGRRTEKDRIKEGTSGGEPHARQSTGPADPLWNRGRGRMSIADATDEKDWPSEGSDGARFEPSRSAEPLAPEELLKRLALEAEVVRQAGLQSGATASADRETKNVQAGADPAGQKAQAGQAPGPGFAGAPVNPRWGRAGGTGVAYSSRGAGTPPGGAGGAWVWLPEGMQPPKSWRKRHPILFWGSCILILLIIFSWGRMSVEDGPLTGPRIAVINLEGVILDATATVNWIEKIRKDATIKGAVLRINSPGGAVGPSQEIFAAVKRLDAVKPVIASMGALAASGGYYAALGAREIYASPSTLTASIGVKMQVPNFGELMKTIGISEQTLTTGKLKDAGSSWRPMTPDEESYLRALLTDMYEEFIQTVARERELPLDVVRQLADGRAMTGRQALEAELVDTLGDQYEALRHVMRLCNLPESPQTKIVEGPEKPASMFRELVSGILDIGLEQKRRAEQPVFMY